MLGLSFGKKNKNNGLKEADQGSAAGVNNVRLNVRNYYEEFVSKFTELSFYNDLMVDELVECFVDALAIQGFNLREGGYISCATEDAIADLAIELISNVAKACSEKTSEYACGADYHCIREDCDEDEMRLFEVCKENILPKCSFCMRYSSKKLCSSELNDNVDRLNTAIATTIFYLCYEFSGLSYIRIMKMIIDCDEVSNVPWSFASFYIIIEHANVYNFFLGDVERIWKDYFNRFMEYANKDDIIVLRIPSDDDIWFDKLKEYITNGTYLKLCPRFILQDLVAEFPELTNLVFETTLMLVVSGEYARIQVIDILELLADYQKYQSYCFPSVLRSFSDIIRATMENECIEGIGAQLTKVSDILVDVFGLSRETVENVIEKTTLDLMGITNVNNYTLTPGKLSLLSYLLANKTVFDTVEAYNPHIIDQFACTTSIRNPENRD